MFGEPRVRTGHLMVGMLKTPSLRNALMAISQQFEQIKPDTLTEDFARIVNGSPEDALGATDGSSLAAPGEASDAMAPGADGQAGGAQALRDDLTEKARKGEIDPVSGRDEEIRQIVDILMRRRQNNPILTGEAGVGKTAVVEGFALRLAHGDVPPPLQNVSLLHARHRPAAGRREHEGRVREPAAAGDRRGAGVAQADHPVHRRGAHADRRRRRRRHRRRRQPAEAGAGARHAAHDRRDDLGRVQEVHREGSGADAALPGREGGRAERGQGDPDGARRRLHAREASPGAGARRGARGGGAAVAPLHSRRGSCRTRRSACSTRRARASRSASTRCRRSSRTAGARIEALQTELEIIGREETVGVNANERRKAAEEKLAKNQTLRESLEARWKAERELVDRVLAIRAKLRQGSEPVEGTGSKLETGRGSAEGGRSTGRGCAGRRAGDAGGADRRCSPNWRTCRRSSSELQGESPLILPSVDEQAVGIGRAGLDRHAGRPHGEERDRDGAESRRDAEPARDRPAPRAGDDRASASRRRARSSTTRTSRSACSCCAARPASARPRRR